MARDPHEPARRVLAQVKNNLAPPQPSLAFTFAGGSPAAPQLAWQGQCPWQADQLVAGHTAAATAGNPRERARDFLATLLEEGPRTSQDIWEEAVAQGVTKRTLNRCKRELGIRSTIVSRDGRRTSYWLLPGQKLPRELANDDYDLEPWLAPLREKYPPRNPLDDL